MKKKALSVILSVAMLSTPVSASAEEIGFTDGTAIEETVAPEKVGLSGEEADLPKEVPSSEDEGSSIEEAGVQDVEDEPSDQSEEAPGIIEEVSDSSEEASLFEDNYDDEDDDDDSENGTYTLFVNPESQENSGVCGANAVWKIENGVMTISGSGALYNKYAYDETKEWTDVEKVVIEEGITSIPD